MKNKFFNDFKKGIKDVDDAELGHAVKLLATRLRCPGGNISAHATLASKMLVFCTEESHSFEFCQEVTSGRTKSKYFVKVERVKQ